MGKEIKNATSLLDDIATGLKRFGSTPLDYIEVVFYEGKKKLAEFGVALALDHLANDVYFDAESNWAEADRAEVRSM